MPVSKAKVLILTDPHLHKNNLVEVRSVFIQALEKAKELGLKSVHCAGDIFDSRQAQSERVLNAFEDILDEYAEHDMNLIAIAGNHDKTDYTSYSSYLRVYKHHPAFTYVEKGGAGLFGTFALVMFPYIREDMYNDELKKAIKIAKETTKDLPMILLTHIAVNGVVNNDKTLIENDLDGDKFKAFNKVLVGHYHDKSRLGKNIYYIGACRQMNYGETPDKGFVVVNDDMSLDHIVAEFPLYISMKVNLSDGIDETIKKAKVELKKGNHVRVVASGTKEEVNALDKQRFYSVGIDLKVNADDITVDLNYLDNVNYSRLTSEEIKDEFGIFAKRQKIKDPDKGLNYLKKVL